MAQATDGAEREGGVTSYDVTLIVVGIVQMLLGLCLGYLVAARAFRRQLRVLVADLEALHEQTDALLVAIRA